MRCNNALENECLIRKNERERDLDNLIKRIRGTFRFASADQQDRIILELKEFCNSSLD